MQHEIRNQVAISIFKNFRFLFYYFTCSYYSCLFLLPNYNFRYCSVNCRTGLSKHFQGKSQSFACLSNVRCLEHLAKPEKPYRKKLNSSKSYGGGLDSHKALSQKACSRTITKKASKGSFPSLSGRKQNILGSRPPALPKRIASFSDQTLFFA